ncbi:MAG: hypothetical protein KY437_00330 [Actinobacteria bacterium]|nr:hypothetical protein [Actinomycetota bacterium]
MTDTERTTSSRWSWGDVVFAAGFGLYALAGIVPLVAGLAAWLAIVAGWHDGLHELAFVHAGTRLGRGAEALADAAHTAPPWGGIVLDYGFSLFNLALAGFLLWLRPRDRTARLLAVALVGSSVIFNLQAYSVWEVFDADTLEVALHVGSHVIAALSYVLALALFPDGTLIPRWSRARQVVLYVALSGAALAATLAIRGTSRTLALMIVFGVLTPLVGVAAQLYRRRTATTEHERQQARTLIWVMMPALVLGVVTVALGATDDAFTVYEGRQIQVIPVAMFRVFQPAFAIIPLALFVGIVRFRLWDIDRVITRTLAYSALAAFVSVVYVAVVVGLGRLVGAQGNNVALSIVATGLIAVGFEPVKERVQRLANRLVYGRRATPYEVLSKLAERLGGSEPSQETLGEVARLLAEGTGAVRTDVWVAVGSRLRPTATWPEDTPSPPALRILDGQLPPIPDVTAAVPVTHQGELLGALSVTKPRAEALEATEARLLEHLAAQAGLVMRNVRLTAELLERLEQLRASRQRLVVAQDEERRKLERNLHDGAQQQLVALKVKLTLAERIAESGKPVGELLQQLGAETQDAIETLRDLARGIYPPLLAAQGLPAALTAQGNKAALPVVVECEGIDRYNQDVEAAVYFCCLEALQNIAKYAGASLAAIRLREADGWLEFSVVDDGVGFDAETVVRGAGLQNMADRLDAVGGRVDIRSEPGSGTTLSGRVPAVPMESPTPA